MGRPQTINEYLVGFTGQGRELLFLVPTTSARNLS
jgi:hypothetical protein